MDPEMSEGGHKRMRIQDGVVSSSCLVKTTMDCLEGPSAKNVLERPVIMPADSLRQSMQSAFLHASEDGRLVKTLDCVLTRRSTPPHWELDPDAEDSTRNQPLEALPVPSSVTLANPNNISDQTHTPHSIHHVCDRVRKTFQSAAKDGRLESILAALNTPEETLVTTHQDFTASTVPEACYSLTQLRQKSKQILLSAACDGRLAAVVDKIKGSSREERFCAEDSQCHRGCLAYGVQYIKNSKCEPQNTCTLLAVLRADVRCTLLHAVENGRLEATLAAVKKSCVHPTTSQKSSFAPEQLHEVPKMTSSVQSQEGDQVVQEREEADPLFKLRLAFLKAARDGSLEQALKDTMGSQKAEEVAAHALLEQPLETKEQVLPVEELRRHVRQSLAKSAGNGDLQHVLASIPRDEHTEQGLKTQKSSQHRQLHYDTCELKPHTALRVDHVRHMAKEVFLQASRDGRLAAALRGLPRSGVPLHREVTRSNHPNPAISTNQASVDNLRSMAKSAFLVALGNGSLATALMELRNVTKQHKDEGPWGVHDEHTIEVNTLKHQLRCSLLEAEHTGRLASVLRGIRRLAVHNERSLDPDGSHSDGEEQHPLPSNDVEDLRTRLKSVILQSLQDGSLSAELTKVRVVQDCAMMHMQSDDKVGAYCREPGEKKPNSEKYDGPQTDSSNVDDIRAHVKSLLVNACQDGRLSAQLFKRRLDPHTASEGARAHSKNNFLRGLKVDAFASVLTSRRDSRQSALTDAVLPQQLGMDQAAGTAASLYGHPVHVASSDRNQVLPRPAILDICSGMRTALQQAQQDGRLERVLVNAHVPDVESGICSDQQVNTPALKQQLLDTLLHSEQDGRLHKALSEIKQRQATCSSAVAEGLLEDIGAFHSNKQCSIQQQQAVEHHKASVRLDCSMGQLQQHAKHILLKAAMNGQLAELLSQRLRHKLHRDAVPQSLQTNTLTNAGQDIASSKMPVTLDLRRRARQALLIASSNGGFEAAIQEINQRRQSPESMNIHKCKAGCVLDANLDSCLRLKARETLGRAFSDGRLEVLVESMQSSLGAAPVKVRHAEPVNAVESPPDSLSSCTDCALPEDMDMPRNLEVEVLRCKIRDVLQQATAKGNLSQVLGCNHVQRSPAKADHGGENAILDAGLQTEESVVESEQSAAIERVPASTKHIGVEDLRSLARSVLLNAAKDGNLMKALQVELASSQACRLVGQKLGATKVPVLKTEQGTTQPERKHHDGSSCAVQDHLSNSSIRPSMNGIHTPLKSKRKIFGAVRKATVSMASSELASPKFSDTAALTVSKNTGLQHTKSVPVFRLDLGDLADANEKKERETSLVRSYQSLGKAGIYNLDDEWCATPPHANQYLKSLPLPPAPPASSFGSRPTTPGTPLSRFGSRLRAASLAASAMSLDLGEDAARGHTRTNWSDISTPQDKGPRKMQRPTASMRVSKSLPNMMEAGLLPPISSSRLAGLAVTKTSGSNCESEANMWSRHAARKGSRWAGTSVVF